MGFPRQEYWAELPCPSPGDLPDPGIEQASLESPASAGWFFTTRPPEVTICTRTFLSYGQKDLFGGKNKLSPDIIWGRENGE